MGRGALRRLRRALLRRDGRRDGRQRRAHPAPAAPTTPAPARAPRSAPPLPWLVALAVALLALGLARLLGPVFSPPAANAWLLSTPVDRGALLRPGWGPHVALTVGGHRPRAAGARGARRDLRRRGGGVPRGAGSATALACVAVAALSQVREDRVSRWLTWALTCGAVVAAGPLRDPRRGSRAPASRWQPASPWRGPRRPGGDRARLARPPGPRPASRDASSATPSTCPPASRARSPRSTSD